MDPITLAFLFPLMIGVLVTSAVFFAWRFSTVPCPCCHKRIPKDVIKNSVPCPECGEVTGEDSCDTSNTGAGNVCHKCNETTSCRKLWDGESYCQSCLETFAPALLKHVEEKWYCEEANFSIKQVAQRILLFYIGIPGCLVTLTVIYECKGNLLCALQGTFLFLLFFLPVISLILVASIAGMAMGRPKVILWNGKLIVHTGPQLLMTPLSNCQWREGLVAFDSNMKLAFLLPGNALLIQYKEDKYGPVTRIAVGFTPESNEIWRQLFTLAEIPQESPMNSLWKSY